MRAKIQKMTNRTVIEKRTVLGQPVFGLNVAELIKDVSTYKFFILLVGLVVLTLIGLTGLLFSGFDESAGLAAPGIHPRASARRKYLQAISVCKMAQAPCAGSLRPNGRI
jgi:hypothetical protein